MGRIAHYHYEERAAKRRKECVDRLQTQINQYEECIVHLESDCMVRLLTHTGCSNEYLREFFFVGERNVFMDTTTLSDCLEKLDQTKRIIAYLKSEIMLRNTGIIFY